MDDIIFWTMTALTLLGAFAIFGMNVANMSHKHPKIFRAIIWAELVIVTIFTIYGVGSAIIGQIIKDIN